MPNVFFDRAMKFDRNISIGEYMETAIGKVNAKDTIKFKLGYLLLLCHRIRHKGHSKRD